jgi:putative redox protein
MTAAIVNRVTARIGNEHYPVAIEAGRHRMAADEPVIRGGGGTAPTPYDILLASLAACTAITLRMYADRKQWDLTSLKVDVRYVREDGKDRIDRTLSLEGNLSDEQRVRFAEIADRTPVTLVLKQGMPIATRLDPPVAIPTAAGDTSG